VLDTRRRRALALREVSTPGPSKSARSSRGPGLGDSNAPYGPVPSGRGFAAAAYDSIGDRTLVYGGRLLDTELGDLWQLTWPDTLHPQWTRLFAEGGAPSPRWGAASVYDPVRRRIVLFGGYSGRPEADTWVLELAGTLRWRKLEPRGFPPSARFCASAVYDSRRDGMILYGGNGNSESNPVPLGDTWFLSFIDGDVWVPLNVAGQAPLARWMHAAMYDPVRKRTNRLLGPRPDRLALRLRGARAADEVGDRAGLAGTVVLGRVVGDLALPLAAAVGEVVGRRRAQRCR
jgi:hypothetical protein